MMVLIWGCCWWLAILTNIDDDENEFGDSEDDGDDDSDGDDDYDENHEYADGVDVEDDF